MQLSVRDLSEQATGQEVADEYLKVRGENVHIATVRARRVPVGQRAAHLVAAGEEGGGSRVPVRARLQRSGQPSPGLPDRLTL